MKFYTSVEMIGNNIFERGFENGKRYQNKVQYEPTLFVPTNKESKYRALDGRALAKIKPGLIRDCREFIREYDGIEGFDVHGNTNYPYVYISEEHPQTPLDYDYSQVIVANVDIETGSDNGFPNPQTVLEPVISITMCVKDTYYVWGCNDYEVSREDVKYFQCADEQQLLSEFLHAWDKIGPDIITGWNIQFFDIPYLVNRIEKILGPKYVKMLSPWRIVDRQQVNLRFAGQKEIDIFQLIGVSTLDYLDLYKKFTYTNQESYRLDYIGHIELGERKIAYDEYASLHELYKQNYQKFIDYNIKDVEIVQRLEDKMKLIEMACALAYDAKVNYANVFTNVRMWDTLIYNRLREDNIIVPPKRVQEKNKAYTGAHVKDPITGMHKWMVSFDLNSLYPHLIMQYNISPDTIVEGGFIHSTVDQLLEKQVDNTKAVEGNYSMAASGQLFRKDIKGFLPQMMQERYDNRVVYKKKMLEAKQKLEQTTDKMERWKLEKEISKFGNLQMAMKISLNSAYGAMGNQYFRFFDMRIAEAITLGGQLSIRWAEKAVNKHLNKVLKTDNKDYVVASDTDSLYITLDALVEKIFPDQSDTTKVINFLDRVCEEDLQKIIDKAYNDLCEYMNAYEQKMFMKRENLADKGIWTGKKHYLLNVFDSEGVRYAEPKLKIMGIEAIKSSTPTACRAKLKEAFNLIMTTDEPTVQKFIKDFEVEFRNSPIEDIAFPRSVKGIEKYSHPTHIYDKGTPIHVKGTLLHNHYIKQKKLTNKYQLIQEGEKIKFINLKQPNPIRDTVIAMLNGLPKEFDLDDYIDYDVQFSKSFKEPLADILKTIGWSAEKVHNLSSFFK